MQVSPATIGNQYNSRVEVSSNVRVGVQVVMLGSRYVYSHPGVIDLLAPCTNGGETGAVVLPTG